MDHLFHKLNKIAKWCWATLPRRIVSSLLIILMIIGPVSFLLFKKEAKASWWDDKWGYRKVISVANSSGGALADFQVKALSNTDISSDITAGKIQSDLDDFRFTDQNGNLLNYWIEDSTGSSVDVWIKVPSIPTSGAAVYFYYGNPSAISAQNGEKVFEFFDDFSAVAINTEKWSTGTIGSTSGTDFSLSSGKLNGGNTNRYAQSKTAFTGNYSAETRVYTNSSPTNGYSTVGFYVSSSNSFGILDHSGSSYYRNDTGWTGFSYSGTGQWNRDRAQVVGTTGTYWREGETSGSATNTASNSGISGEYLRLGPRYDDGAYDQNFVAQWDWVFVRKAASTEPVSSSGTEEVGPGPVGYWSFDEGYGTTAYNNTSVSGINATLSANTTWKSESDCVSGKCANNISNGNITIPDNDRLDFGTSNFSVSFWTNVRDYTYPKALFNMRKSSACYNSGTAYTGFDIGHSYNANGINACINDGTNLVNNLITFDNGYKPADTKNKWTHYTIIFDRTAGRVKAYVNGVKQTSELNVSSVTGSITNDQPINVFNIYGWQMDGMLDELKIFPYARTADQIKQDYNAGTAGAKSSSGTSASFGGQSDKWLTDGLVGYWKMDEAVGAWDSDTTADDAIDSSGNGNTGSAYGDADSASNGKFGNGGSFDGTGDYVSLANTNFDFTQSFTVSGWINPSISPPAEQCFFGVASTFQDNQSIHMRVYSNGSLLLGFYGDDLGDYTGPISFGNWNHVVMSYDLATDTSKIFVNGKQTASGNQGPFTGTNPTISIGTWAPATQPFNGKIDDFRVYNRALAPDEVSKLYNWAPGPVAHWKMDDSVSGNGQTIVDASGYGKNGTTDDGANNTGMDCTVQGKYGTACNFDGTDDYVNMGNVGSANTITYWVKSAALENGGIELNSTSFIRDMADIYGINNAQIYIDGVKYLGSDLVTNGNFASNITGWTADSGNSPISWQNAASGDGSTGYMRWNIGSNTNWDRFKSDTNTTAANTDYRVSFWYRTSGITSQPRPFSADNFTTFLNKAWYYDLPLNASWTYASVLLSTDSLSYPIFGFGKPGDIGTGYMDLDAIKVQQVENQYPLTDANWHHVAITTDTVVDASAVKIGKGGTSYLNGSIDDVRIYNYARTQKQIVEDMNAGHPAGGSPIASQVGYYKFDEGYGNTAYDKSINGNNGTLTSGTTGGNTTVSAMWDKNGKFGGAIEFDGTDDYVSLADNLLDSHSQGSVCAWAKADNYTTAHTILGFGDTASSNYKALFYTETDATLNFHLRNNTTANYLHIVAPKVLNAGAWYHFCATQDGNHVKLFIDGTEQSVTETIVGTATAGDWFGTLASSCENVDIGRLDDNAPGEYFDGLIDEVKIYPFALTAEEVKTDFNKGAAATMGYDASRDNNGTAVTGKAKDYCIPGDSSPCAGPVGEWKLDKISGLTTYDTSGNGNNGSLGGGTAQYAPVKDPVGKIGNALRFDGADDFVEVADNVSNPLELSGNFTVSLWIKTPFEKQTAAGYWPGIFGKGASASAPANGWGFTQHGENGGNGNCNDFWWQQDTAGGGAFTATLSSGCMSNGWHYAVVRRSSTTSEMYVDGKFITNDTTAGGDLSNSYPFRLGRDNGSEYMKGTIDDIKIFSYARTPAQIAWDYNRGGPVAEWKFDECQGATVYDSSDAGLAGNGNNGTINLGASGVTALGTCSASGTTFWYNGRSGKFNASGSFDGTDDKISLSGPVLSTVYTVSFWIRPQTNDTYGAILGESTSEGFFFKSDTNKISFYYDSSNFLTSSALTLGTWNHYTAVSNGVNVIFYLNGIPDGDTGANVGPALTIALMGDDSSSETFEGQIDDVKIFNYALTSTQVKDIYNGGAASFR